MRLRLRLLGQLVLVGVGVALVTTWIHDHREPARERPFTLASAPAPAAPAPAASPRALLQLAPIPHSLDVAPGEVEAAALVRRWAAVRGLVATVDPQIQQVRLTFDRPATLSARDLRDVLDMHDVVLVRGRGDALHAHHRRNLAQKEGPPWDRVTDEVVDPDRIVTREIPIRHGAGNAIFAAVRGLLTRDTNRIGNILYVQGSERIIVVDLAHKVRYYEEVIHGLDQPAARRAAAPARLVAFRVDGDDWRELQGAGATAQAAALDELAADGDAERLADLLLVLGAGGARAEVAAGEDGLALTFAEQGDRLVVTATAPAEDGEGDVRRALVFADLDSPRPHVLATTAADGDGYLVVAAR